MTVYDLDYTWYNGSVAYASTTLSNTSIVNTLLSPFSMQIANLAQNAAGEYTTGAFVDQWTIGFSTMVLAMSAGIMAPCSNIIEQQYTSMLVVRVPKSPLIMLVFLNLLYAVVGVVLAVIAAMAKPAESKNVQGRLSVAGLVAACFEEKERVEGPAREIEDLFAERKDRVSDHGCKNVSIVESELGGWKYNVKNQRDDACHGYERTRDTGYQFTHRYRLIGD